MPNSSQTIAVIGAGFSGTVVAAHLLARGTGGTALPEILSVGTVMSCTGPNGDLRSIPDPLVSDLRRRGLIRPDPLGLGVHVSDDYAAVDIHGRASRFLYGTGPLLRARWCEATAVPELRVHAAQVAQLLTEPLAQDRPRRSIA